MSTGRCSEYDTVTGELTGLKFSSSDEDWRPPPAQGLAFVEGIHDRRTHRVDLATMKVVPRETPLPEHPVDKRMRILGQIDALERSQHRALREALLGDAAATERLQAIDVQIAALRAAIASAAP